MSASASFRALHELLAPARLTEVVDIGANPIDGTPPYAAMLAEGLCRVTGFEPQREAFEALQRKKGPNERYLADAIGDGSAHTLKVCAAPGMSSLLEPDPDALALFDVLRELGQVVDEFPVQTRRLDDIAEIEHLDLLKIDIQGGEHAVFRGGTGKLSRAIAIQTEVAFVSIYQAQPSFGDIDLELRRQGFIPHCFTAFRQWPISPFVLNNNPRQPLNQLHEADIVYARDFSRPERMDDEQLKHLALVAHCCYRSFDLALRCVMLLERRRALEPGAQVRYAGLLAPRQLAG